MIEVFGSKKAADITWETDLSRVISKLRASYRVKNAYLVIFANAERYQNCCMFVWILFADPKLRIFPKFFYGFLFMFLTEQSF